MAPGTGKGMTDKRAKRQDAFAAMMAARGRNPSETPRILVAEDDPDMRELLTASLRDDGFNVEEASDGGRLLVRVASTYAAPDTSIDLIISDIRMPICDGLQILRNLRRANWKIPVILMTAFSDPTTEAEATKLGAVLIDKPFDLDAFRTTVISLLA